MNDTNKSLDQERAAYAWRCVAPSRDKEYVALSKGAPAMIMTNGLMQALAFLEAKGKKEGHHRELLKHILGWLSKRGLDAADFAPAMTKLHARSSEEYMQLTEEALEILRWIRQFADAVKK